MCKPTALRPVSSGLDVRNQAVRNAKPFGDFTVGLGSLSDAVANLGNVGGGELGRYAPLTVDRVGYRLQVVGVDTQTDAAKVVQFKPFGDRAFCSRVIETVGSNRLSAASDAPVSVSLLCSLPDPTRRGVPAVLEDVRHRGQSIIVAPNVPMGRPSDHASRGISGLGYRRESAATTQTATRRIRTRIGILGVHSAVSSSETVGAVARAVSAAPGRFMPKLYHREALNA